MFISDFHHDVWLYRFNSASLRWEPRVCSCGAASPGAIHTARCVFLAFVQKFHSKFLHFSARQASPTESKFNLLDLSIKRCDSCDSVPLFLYSMSLLVEEKRAAEGGRLGFQLPKSRSSHLASRAGANGQRFPIWFKMSAGSSTGQHPLKRDGRYRGARSNCSMLLFKSNRRRRPGVKGC